MSVSKINFNDNQEAYIVVDPISEIDKADFKKYLDLDSPSFLKCEFENDKAFTLYYSYGSRIVLKQFLSRVVQRDEAIAFLKSLTRVYMDAEDHNLNTAHILLGINSIFYDADSRQVSCVYVPVAEGTLPARPLRLFLKEMLVNMVYDEEENMEWLGNVIRYISRNRNFSYSEFYEFLQTQEEEITEPVPEMEADAEPKAEEAEDEVAMVLESIPAAESVGVLKDAEEIPLEVMEEVDETEAEDSEEASILEVLTIDGKTEPDGAEEEPAPEEEDVPEEDKTESVLIRRSNHTVYPLDKDEKRIGKSGDMDISISDNPAVSRIHAAIKKEDKGFVLRDLGSTNHTFVNGILMKTGEEKVLSSGDRILFGNEEFIFKM